VDALIWGPFDRACRLLLGRLESVAISVTSIFLEYYTLLDDVRSAFGNLASSDALLYYLPAQSQAASPRGSTLVINPPTDNPLSPLGAGWMCSTWLSTS